MYDNHCFQYAQVFISILPMFVCDREYGQWPTRHIQWKLNCGQVVTIFLEINTRLDEENKHYIHTYTSCASAGDELNIKKKLNCLILKSASFNGFFPFSRT